MKLATLKNFTLVGGLVALVLALLLWSGCTEEEISTTPHRTTSRTATTTASKTAPASPAGINLDANLLSSTGTPDAEDMKVLIELQKKVAYPLVAPTYLPGSVELEADLVSAGRSTSDPVGYYSFRYSDPGNPSRSLTFNQSKANSKPLSGYYLTEVNLGGIDFQVYWHRTRVYLAPGEPVRTNAVGDAEAFVVIWKSSFKDASGADQELFYSITTGTWTGWGWGEIKNILAGLKPLGSVGE